MKAQQRLAVLFAILALGGMTCEQATADTFGSGDNVFEIPFVSIGEAGNDPDLGVAQLGDPNPTGSVAYEYRIGKYEIPEEAIRKANPASALDGNPLGLTLDERGPQKPATGISWFEAAQFVNWLNEEKGQTPAYKFDGAGVFQLWAPTDAGYNAANPFRNTQAHYFLPSADEWYKAAFYNPATGGYFDFPTGSNDDTIPVELGTDPGTAVFQQTGPADVMLAGGESPFDTVAQAGNVNEWEETAADLLSDTENERRGLRSGSYIFTITTLNFSSAFRNATIPGAESRTLGFRIASIPEPASLGLFCTGCLSILLASRRL